MSGGSGVLGSTGLRVSRIGLGLAALGRPAYITLGRDRDLGSDRDVDAMERRAHVVLDVAYEAGVRYVDAARSYGHAERFLASWLAARPSAMDVTVGSKWGYRYTAGWRPDAEVNEVKDHSLAALRRQYAESRRILGDRLALYQIHSATLETGVLEDRSVLGELARLATEEGLAIGLTASGPRQADVVRRAMEASVDGVNPFSTVQATWNLLDPSVAPALEEAHAAGWGVIVKESVANGRLTSSGPALAELDGIASAHGVTADAVAIAAILSRPWGDVCLSGAVTADQILSNVAAVDIQLSEDDVGRLAMLAESPEQYWRTRAGLPWG